MSVTTFLGRARGGLHILSTRFGGGFELKCRNELEYETQEFTFLFVILYFLNINININLNILPNFRIHFANIPQLVI